MNKITKFFSIGSFGSNVLTLMTGTTIAQAIPLLVSPIIMRLYDPLHYGELAIYMCINALIAIIATGRYELAILLPEKEQDAENIASIACILAFIVSLFIFIVIILFKGYLSTILLMKPLLRIMYLLPVSIFLSSLSAVLSCYINRKQHYKALAFSRAITAIATSGTTLLCGFAGWGTKGLIAGYVTGQIVSSSSLGWQLWYRERLVFSSISKSKIVEVLKRYENFPKFSLFTDFINVLSNRIPVLMISAFFGNAPLGSFSLAQRILGTPSAFVGNAISEVFRQRASKEYNAQGNCEKLLKKTITNLLLVGFIPFILIFLYSPELFSIIFGSKWRQAGEFAQILALMYFCGFITGPVSYVFYIANKQKLNFLLHLVLLVSVCFALLLGAHMQSVKISLLAFSLTYSGMYLIYLLLSYNFSEGMHQSH